MLKELLPFLVSLITHSMCELYALNQTGTMTEENLIVNASDVVTVTCQTICGEIEWHLNGQKVVRGSQQAGLYQVKSVQPKCSTSEDPMCPQCNCASCNTVEYGSSQIYSSLINITVNGSFVLNCMSVLNYPHEVYTLLRRRFNINVVANENVPKSTPLLRHSSSISYPTFTTTQKPSIFVIRTHTVVHSSFPSSTPQDIKDVNSSPKILLIIAVVVALLFCIITIAVLITAYSCYLRLGRKPSDA